uniref:Uncharacterized protein n=1 Tax=Arundo donax TaxID=35708 RepID=A0A0A8Z594_ARUDO
MTLSLSLPSGTKYLVSSAMQL